MKNYYITEDTLAILPYDSKKSLIYDNRGNFIVDKTPQNIIKFNCLVNGSTYSTNLARTISLTGYNYKSPIVINYDKDLVFFPTTSTRLKDCIWVSLNNILSNCFDNQKMVSIIKFYNGVKLEINQSLNVINNQILRANRLSTLFRKLSLQKA